MEKKEEKEMEVSNSIIQYSSLDFMCCCCLSCLRLVSSVMKYTHNNVTTEVNQYHDCDLDIVAELSSCFE